MNFAFNMETEEICGHLVTAKMKRVWFVQLQMVSKFAEVCERHNLKWFASGGTLLGAVRHKGYIPWDDDIDIHMLADDYEKFCQVAQEELRPYFWQEYRTQYGYGPWHGKIRDSRTTGCTRFELSNWDASMNRGIFIDIFPLYYIPESKHTKRKQLLFLKLYRRLIGLYEEYEIYSHKGKRRHGIRWLEYILCKKVLRVDFYSLCTKFRRACQMATETEEYVGATSFDFTEPRFVWPTQNYREMVDLPFMGGYIKAPIEWDACLKQQYGDYLKIIKGGSLHGDILFDVETPYSVKLSSAYQQNQW